MKNIIMVFILTAFFAACKNSAKTGDQPDSKNAATYSNPNAEQSAPVNYTNSNSSTNTAKRGMSKAAKGAIIGGASGTVAGAIITKSGKGAVVGGLIGVTAGYLIGRKKDKRDGRVRNN
jgi:outer membrane lipoprotein SlyB